MSDCDDGNVTMYLDFYGLRKAPFQITPDPDFLFLSPSHKVALGAIIYGIEDRQGFVAITGQVGLGKTTILRSYLERVDSQQLRTICIFNANISFEGLLKTIYAEFDLEYAPGDLYDRVKQLHQTLIDEYQQGRNIALIIDEAQNMPIQTLENLRLLSNLETATEKLIQIVLIGQPEFEAILNREELQQLKQRLVIHETIAPLTPKESVAYIHHRLDKVKTHDEPIFSKAAENLLVSTAKGTPRVLNTLCTNALIAGVGYQEKPLSAKTVKQVATNLLGKPSPLTPSKGWLYGLAALAALLLLGFLWLSPVGSSLMAKLTGQPQTPDVEPPESIPTKLSQLNPFQTTTTPPEDTTSTPPPPDTPEQPLTTTSVTSPDPSTPEPVTSPPIPNVTPETRGTPETPETPETPTQAVKVNPPENQSGTHTGQLSIPTSTPESEVATFPITVSVSPGEDVSSIIQEIYGFANKELLALIKDNNPEIKDLDKVAIGQRIILPALPAAFDKFRGTQ